MDNPSFTASSHSPEGEPILWYYVINDQQYGPVPEEEIAALYRSGTIHTRTGLWCPKLVNWTALNETELYERIVRTAPGENASQDRKPLPQTPPPFLGSNPQSSRKKRYASEYAEEMNNWYTFFWIFSIVGLCLLVILIGLIPLIVAIVFECFILYRAWKTMPQHPFGVPPILAILLMFVPVAGAIWAFWLYYFFTQEINNELDRRKSSLEINELYPLLSCIFSAVGAVILCIPTAPTLVIGLLILVPATIFNIITVSGIKNGAIAIHEDELRLSAKEQESK